MRQGVKSSALKKKNAKPFVYAYGRERERKRREWGREREGVEERKGERERGAGRKRESRTYYINIGNTKPLKNKN